MVFPSPPLHGVFGFWLSDELAHNLVQLFFFSLTGHPSKAPAIRSVASTISCYRDDLEQAFPFGTPWAMPPLFHAELQAPLLDHVPPGFRDNSIYFVIDNPFSKAGRDFQG